jgi:hypothetical protein
MNKSLSFYSRRLGLLLLFSASLAFLLVPRALAQAPPQDPQATTTTPAGTAPQSDAEKKAAERKKRFEEQKKLLDGGGSAGAGASAASHAPQKDWEFWMDPLYANMLTNETVEIHMWDWRNNDVSARVSWSLSGSGVVDMTVKHHAILTARVPGTVSVIGQIDGRKTIEAIVTVYRGEKLPSGTPRTVSSPPTRTEGRRNVQTVTVQP